jgi:signal transduction histidine kinase
MGSPFQLHQLFLNLIGNSLKFCVGKPVIEIKCAKLSGAEMPNRNADADRLFWRLSVIDNGIGFDIQLKDMIFEPFRRLHGRQEFSGTGIGLSIVRSIVRRHKGFVDVESEPGKGTTFYIWLPA